MSGSYGSLYRKDRPLSTRLALPQGELARLRLLQLPHTCAALFGRQWRENWASIPPNSMRMFLFRARLRRRYEFNGKKTIAAVVDPVAVVPAVPPTDKTKAPVIA